MTVIYYNSIQQKKAIKLAGILRGESTIHDDFIDRLGQSTNGKSGRLTLGTIPDPLPRVKKGLNELNQRLKDKDLDYLDLLDLLEIQALKLNSTRWENFKALFGL